MTDTTMKLNHLSFPSSDLAATAAFFEKHLGCTIASRGDWGCILKRPGFDIVIEDAAQHAVDWPPNFHLGFELPSVAEVETLCGRLKADGIEMQQDFFKHPRGSRFFCRAPGGFLLEINTRADAEAPYRGTFDN
ncbi:MAG TPA: VOC family protein [Aliidongia sp.]|uniref:VOC family protein n=1 Tax=Aliidongia sp. TaxID=1914230 RepID=UPI002DDDBAE5|nr:VOC family protein [Aliidongia sp.]HEV2676051.1 VOC family protein [Aliidongia sp.]